MNSNASNTVSIKFRLATKLKSCRRARIEIPLTMSAVTRKLSTCFPELQPGQFSIQYQDEEGEQIEVVNDADLAEALAVFNAIGRVLSFSILPQPTKAVESEESEGSDESDGHGFAQTHFQKHLRNHWQNHHGCHGRRGGWGRRWHALAHMMGMRPQDMNPQMQNMMRFGMLKHFRSNDKVGRTGETDLQCTFVSDVTIADGTVMQPHQSFNKKWLVKTGTKAWPAGCTLVHVGGHPMGTRRRNHTKFTIGVVPANSEIEVMVVLQAPKRSREFVSKWRMCTPEGVQFGDTMWANIRVQRTPAALPTEEIDLECKFVADGSIPDGTTMQPHQQFDKEWVVKTGKTAWPAGCALVHVSGNGMGTKSPKFKPAPLGVVPADSKIVLKATMHAPKRTNNFVSKWRMCTPEGRQFGDYLWTFINVEESGARTVPDTGLQCSFVADATIPDHAVVPPKEHFEKKWIVKTGPKPWPKGCVLTHVGGHAMGTKRAKAKPAPLGPVPANTEVELAVVLKAPKPSRDFVSKWRVCTPDGHQFGDFLWALITVERDAPPLKSASTTELPPAIPAAAKPVAAASKAIAKHWFATATEAVSKPVPVPVAAAAKPVPVPVAKPVPVPVATAAKPVPVAAATEISANLLKLMELNFPVPTEVLAYVLKSTGDDLDKAIGLLLAQ